MYKKKMVKQSLGNVCDDTVAVNSRAFLVFNIIFIVSAPVLISGVLGYYLDYICGDTMLETLYGVLSILSSLLTYLLPYPAIASAIVFFFCCKGIKRAAGIALCAFSMLIPYGASVLTGYFLIADFSSNILYYSFVFGLNGLLFRLIPLFVSVVAMDFTKMLKGVSAVAVEHAVRWSVGFFFAADFIYEIYLSCDFVYELTNEYLRAATANEIVSLITGYLLCIVKSVIGYIIVRFALGVLTKAKNAAADNDAVEMCNVQ